MHGTNALAYCDEVAVTKKEKVLTEVLDQVENTSQGTKALAYFVRVVVTKKKSLKVLDYSETDFRGLTL